VRNLKDPIKRLQRRLAEIRGKAIHGGDDPSVADLLLESEELRLWWEEVAEEVGGDGGGWETLDPDEKTEGGSVRFTEGAADLRPTGDNLIDEFERRLAAGEKVDLDEWFPDA